jgi:hypothetical protein
MKFSHSYFEVFLETPCVSNIEGIAELIKEGRNGFTFVAGNEISLREKLQWCVDHSGGVVKWYHS